jgi:predicted Zn-dependent peptidase
MRKIIIPLLLASFFLLPGCGQEEQKAAEFIEKSQSETLDNSLRLIVLPHDGAPLVTIACRAAAGTAYEDQAEAGYSILLARLLSSESAASETLSSLGAMLSLELQPDALDVWTTVLAADAPTAAAALVETLTVEFDSDRVLNERDRLVAELEAGRADVTSAAGELIDAILYPDAHHAAGAAARIGALESLTTDSFRRFAARCLQPRNTMIAATGVLTEEFGAGLKT